MCIRDRCKIEIWNIYDHTAKTIRNPSLDNCYIRAVGLLRLSLSIDDGDLWTKFMDLWNMTATFSNSIMWYKFLDRSADLYSQSVTSVIRTARRDLPRSSTTMLGAPIISNELHSIRTTILFAAETQCHVRMSLQTTLWTLISDRAADVDASQHAHFEIERLNYAAVDEVKMCHVPMFCRPISRN